MTITGVRYTLRCATKHNLHLDLPLERPKRADAKRAINSEREAAIYQLENSRLNLPARSTRNSPLFFSRHVRQCAPRRARGTVEFLAQLKLAVERDGWSLKLRERPFPFRGRPRGRTWPAEESVSTAEIRRKANSLASLRSPFRRSLCLKCDFRSIPPRVLPCRRFHMPRQFFQYIKAPASSPRPS